MAGTRNMVASLLVAVFVATIMVSDAAEHMVGDADGWKTTTNNEKFYSEWAAKNTFKVGDTLVFKFMAHMHEVTKVSKAAFESCDFSSPLEPTITTTPAKITLKSTGKHYYVCSVNNHCKAGQKVAIKVEGGSGDAASPSSESPSSSPVDASKSSPDAASKSSPVVGEETKATSPAPSSAASLVASFSVVFFCLALSFLC